MKTIAQQIKWDFETNGNLEIKDKNGNRIYWENSNRDWAKWEYDSKHVVYQEDSNKRWAKWERNSQGNTIYYEDSDGVIEDNRPKPSPELTLESLAGQVLKLTEIVNKLVNKP